MKNIEHFLLPEQTNKLYQNEAISSISLTKEVADKINEIVDSLNELSNNDLVWKHEQEGTIRKAIIYIKDNLMNTLHDLIEMLEGNGYFDETVKKYVTELESRVDNLISNNSTDGELIDVRFGTDGVTYKTAGESVRTQFLNITNELNVLFSRIFSKSVNLTLDGYIALGNVVNSNDKSMRSGKIKCEHYDFVKYSTHISNAGYEVALYDKNGSFLSEISVIGDNTMVIDKIVDIKNAYYIEVSCYGSAYYESFKCELFNNDMLSNKTPNKYSDIFSKSVNLTLTGYIALGNVVSNSENARRTGLIDCRNYKYVKYATYLTNAGYELVCYDENGVFMENASVLGQSNFTYGRTLNLEELGVSYIQMCCYGISNSNNAYCILYNSEVSDISTSNSKMLIFGDSITETATYDESSYTENTNTSWVTYIKGILQTNNIKNYAKSGARYRDFEGEKYQSLSEQIELAISDSTNDDSNIIILSLGTNDLDITDSTDTYENAMSITSLDDLDKTKFYQAVRYAMWSLKNKYPDSTCYVATPIQRSSRELYNSISEALIKMGKRYNFIIINAENESGIIRENEVNNSNGKYLKDGLHPNYEGDIRMAKYYSKVILNTYNK